MTGRPSCNGAPAASDEDHLSPTIASAGVATSPAYELKFLLTEGQACEVERRVAHDLTLDPHTDPALGTAYRVTSVYFDTPRFDVFRQVPGYRRHKHRVRRYGAEPVLFLERKSKRGGRVWKRRTAIPCDELNLITNGHADVWPGAWFARQVTGRHLRPVCRVTYDRTAYVGTGPDGRFRLTLDRAARGLAAPVLEVEQFAAGLPLLGDRVIVEFKFTAAMPSVLKGVIEALRLAPAPVSKYRRCAGAAGLGGGNGDA